MFGNFLQNFGLNAFPWDSLDAQGGLFGQNAPQTPLIGSQNAGTATPGGGGTAPVPEGSPPVSPGPSPMSPSGLSPLASPAQPAPPGTPNPAGTEPTAPAAGVGSPFGAPKA